MAEFLHIVSTACGIVALAEIGDKTQLLAVMLAARYRRALPVALGILLATLANHALAAWAGAALAGWLDGPWFRAAVAIGFLGMAGWILVPDTLDDGLPAIAGGAGLGPLLTTSLAFFVVEIGDKTQVATVALGARFDDVLAVTLGTTAGMMLANVPAVVLGEKVLRLVPLARVRAGAALLFAGLGLAMLWRLWAAA